MNNIYSDLFEGENPKISTSRPVEIQIHVFYGDNS
jgi:hypothetical protein